MGLLSNLFGKKNKQLQERRRANNPTVYQVETTDERMNWAIRKAQLTLHYFEKCLRTPEPSQQYFSIKVKILDGDKAEHMWLVNPRFDIDGNLFGFVGNNPIDIKNVKINDRISIDENMVSDWMIIENGRLIGGYTIRAVRDTMTGAQLQKFDKSLGGMQVDDGIDAFLPSNETPEGAIVQIEEAYDQDDLDKAISCKDFQKEAELMLVQKLGEKALTQEIIEPTADALKLAYLASLKDNGMPKFKGVRRAFPKREKVSDKHIIVTEVCYFPDGSKSVQRINTYKTDEGWKVLSPAD